MNSYILIIIADILLAMTFVMQKKYQNIAGSSIRAGLTYNVLMGVAAFVIYLGINKFKIEISLFSVMMAALFTILIMLYVLAGFKIMEKGNISLYTLFLMSGGMTVPYIWGVVFLNEELTIIRTLGLLTIVTAIIISNSGTRKPDKKQLALCVAVFILNGFTSVTSKMHQINPISEVVTSADFAFLTVVFKIVFCSAVLLVLKSKDSSKNKVKLPMKAIVPIIIFAAMADSISFMLQLIGAKDIPATVLYPLVTGGSIILSGFADVIFFREKLSVRQGIGIAICFLGTLLFL